MDHSWRPRPIQGNNNICPTCSSSHFPFCPPHPNPYGYSRPNFESNRGPSNLGRPVYNNYPDPYYDPSYLNKNPNLPPQLGNSGIVNSNGVGYGDHNVSSYDNVNVNDDRSSKRLRVDGVYPGSYRGEGDVNSMRPNMGFGFDGGSLGRYDRERPGFDWNVDGREVESSRVSNNVGMGRGVNYRKDEFEYRSGYNMNRSHGHQIGQYGQVEKPTNVGSSGHGGLEHDNDRQSYGYRPPNYGSNFEQVKTNEYRPPIHGGNFEQVKTNEYRPPIHGSNFEQVKTNEYRPPIHGGNFEHVKTNEYRPPTHGGNFEHVQSNEYRPPNYGRNFENVQSNGYCPPNMVAIDQYSSTHPPLTQPGHVGYGYHSPHHIGDVRQPIDSRSPPVEGYQSLGNQNFPTRPAFVPPHMSKHIEYGNPVSEHGGHLQPSQSFEFQPPLPASPPPPLPTEPPVDWSTEHRPSFSPKKESFSLFPDVHYLHAPTPDSHHRANSNLDNYKIGHASHGTFQGDSHGFLTTFGQYSRGSQPLASKNNLSDKPKTVDAAHLFKQPHRTSRPDHFVIILRGLPGSGKSYFAKMIRDLELEHGGNAPRIHSMDDYFMTEVEKTEENEASKPLGRGKKPVTKTVIEYCYEPEMEEVYRSSMLKAFKKTLDEGVYTVVIVDDRNLRVADFAQFWATAKRSGYEAYMLEAPYKDPAGCTARNVHGFTQDEVEKMAAKWEEAPSLYMQMDVKSLLHGDDLKEGNIEEVDMDTEDGDFDASLSNLDESQSDKTSLAVISTPVSPKDAWCSDADVVNQTEAVKELGRSKWSDNLDDDSDERTELLKGKPNVLSGLLGTSGKEGKSVHWGDQGGRSGFSIGAINKAKVASLVIGPGAGYNVKSNPLLEKDAISGKSGEKKKRSVFKERLQAEQESFRAVFDRRRQRIGIGGVLTEDD